MHPFRLMSAPLWPRTPPQVTDLLFKHFRVRKRKTDKIDRTEYNREHLFILPFLALKIIILDIFFFFYLLKHLKWSSCCI